MIDSIVFALLFTALGLLIGHCAYAGIIPPSPFDWGWWWSDRFWQWYWQSNLTRLYREWRLRNAH